MAIFNEGFIKQWWDRSNEAAIKNRSNEQQKKDAAKKAAEDAARDESHLKEHGLILKREFDRCFAIAKDCFRSSRKLGFASTFRPSEYTKYYVFDKNDYIRLGYISLEEYYETDDDKVWEADKDNFNKLLTKIDKKINDQISAEMKGITFNFSKPMFGNVHFTLDSDKPKEQPKKKDEESVKEATVEELKVKQEEMMKKMAKVNAASDKLNKTANNFASKVKEEPKKRKFF